MRRKPRPIETSRTLIQFLDNCMVCAQRPNLCRGKHLLHRRSGLGVAEHIFPVVNPRLQLILDKRVDTRSPRWVFRHTDHILIRSSGIWRIKDVPTDLSRIGSEHFGYDPSRHGGLRSGKPSHRFVVLRSRFPKTIEIKPVDGKSIVLVSEVLLNCIRPSLAATLTSVKLCQFALH